MTSGATASLGRCDSFWSWPSSPGRLILHKLDDAPWPLYGTTGSIYVREAADGTRYVNIRLEPNQFVIFA